MEDGAGKAATAVMTMVCLSESVAPNEHLIALLTRNSVGRVLCWLGV